MKKSLWITKGIFAAALVMFAQTAFAEEITVTTYYPSPEGEYKSMKVYDSLKVPVKTVGNDTTQVTAGEIWIEE